MKTNYLYGLSILVILLFSCGKEETRLTNTDFLTGGGTKVWIFTAATIDPPLPVGGTTIANLFAQGDPCDLDDVQSFNINGNYTQEEGATKCDPTNPQVFESGTWSFNGDETIILTIVDGETTENIVRELTADRLVIEYILREDGINYTITGTLEPN